MRPERRCRPPTWGAGKRRLDPSAGAARALGADRRVASGARISDPVGSDSWRAYKHSRGRWGPRLHLIGVAAWGPNNLGRHGRPARSRTPGAAVIRRHGRAAIIRKTQDSAAGRLRDISCLAIDSSVGLMAYRPVDREFRRGPPQGDFRPFEGGASPRPETFPRNGRRAAAGFLATSAPRPR